MSSAAIQVRPIQQTFKTEESCIVTDPNIGAIKVKPEQVGFANDTTKILQRALKRKSKQSHGLHNQEENLRRGPPRSASSRARIGVSKAYAPLLIPASLEPDTVTPSPQILDDSDTEMLLNIDDLIDDVETSDDSDGYTEFGVASASRRSRIGHSGKRKNLHGQGASESSASSKRGRRADRLDRADLLLIKGDDPEARKVARRRRLCILSAEERNGLKRKHIESLVSFMADSLDWRYASERLKAIGRGQAKDDPAQEEMSLSAEVLSKHWMEILSKRIIEMYPM